MHQALYLKYRPQTFADVAGQAPVVTTLKRALASQRVGHAYLFTGPRGTGKTTTARLLAKGINCEKPKSGEPCGACETCQAIAAGRLLDLIEIDAASNRGIDEIRELRDKVNVAPSSSARKVYIIDEVHMLTKEAFNALLKTLEEPPAHAVFILATTEPEKVPQTIISRCQRFDFRPAAPSVVAAQLADVAKAEKLKLDEAAAEIIARQARGSFRDALSILDLLGATGADRVTADVVRDTLGLAGSEHVEQLEGALLSGNRAEALAVIKAASESGVAPDTFRRDVIETLRLRLRAKVGAEAGPPGSVAEAWDETRLIAAIRTLLEAGDLAADSLLPELPLELATLEFLSDQVQAPTNLSEATAPAPSTVPSSANKDTSPKKTGAKPNGPVRPPARAAASAGPAQKKIEPVTPDPGPTLTAKPPKDAQDVWERLLEATKTQYSLATCLQRTRPQKLDKQKLHLQVLSDFFLKKLEVKATRQQVEAECQKLLGRKIRVEFSLAEAADGTDNLFTDALKTFEGAEVHRG